MAKETSSGFQPSILVGSSPFCLLMHSLGNTQLLFPGKEVVSITLFHNLAQPLYQKRRVALYQEKKNTKGSRNEAVLQLTFSSSPSLSYVNVCWET